MSAPISLASAAPLHTTRATCPYCGVGCGVLIDHDGESILGVRGDPDHPANFGRLCTKGATLHLSARPETRLVQPLLRAQRDDAPEAVSWAVALDTAASRFAQVIREDGPDAVGFYLSGQLLTEDYYVFNKLVKGLIGTNNVDTNSRLCMSSAVVAYKQTLGMDAPPCCYEDFDHADCLFIAGGNPAYAHPIAYRRIEAAKAARPDLRIIVADPRRTDTAAGADLHLPLLPGTDIWLFNAMLHVLIAEGLVDTDYIAAHTEGFEALRAHVAAISPAVAAPVCGLRAEDIVTAARWWGQAPRALSLWCQGLNQSHHGSHSGAALIALSLATGKIGRLGCGPFSLTGQPNAMGGREVGGLSNLLSGHRDLANPAHRAEVAALWGVPEVPAKPGLSAVELFEAVGAGRVRALWIACTNPAQSMPEQALIRAALARCEFVVLQEAYGNTETAAYAHLLLPAATWGEKAGTVTNSERRISRVRAAVPPLGAARPDWRIARDFARALAPLLPPRADGTLPNGAALFPYETPEDIFAEHRQSTLGRDLDIGGLSYALLESAGPQQWPYPAGVGEGAAPDNARLYGNGVFPTESGRARFVVPVATLVAEMPDERYPLRITTGRLRDQWHGMSRTGKVARLYSHVDEARIELHPGDLAARGIASGDLVQVASRRGQVVLRAFATDDVQPGQGFVAMHWGRNVLSHSGANELTLGVFDPYSRQPELKHLTAQVSPVTLPYQALLLHTTADATAADAAARNLAATLAPWLSRFHYASLALSGREAPAVVLRIAHRQPIPADWLAELDQLFGLDGPDCLTYTDGARHVSKRARLERPVLGRDQESPCPVLTALRLTGETAAATWLQEALIDRLPAGALRRWLFAPLAQAPTASPSRGRILCNCHNVAEADIRTAIAQGANLEALQTGLKCGTACGSCVPELKRLLAGAATQTAGRRVEA